MEKKRGSFTGQIGFVLAAAGSAVGLGNLWRFPYLAAEYGGGSFIFVYIILALTFGFASLEKLTRTQEVFWTFRFLRVWWRGGVVGHSELRM